MTMSLQIDKNLGARKAEILAYLRARAAESRPEISQQFGVREFKERATASNRSLIDERHQLSAVIRQTAQRENWPHETTLQAVLLLMHCTNVVMLEARHEFWPYEYMAFSRRIGELWEPFVTACFDMPTRKDVSLFVPPLFKDIKRRLTQEVRDFIQKLPIIEQDKKSLLRYYDQVWQLVSSGEIKLALDVHFALKGIRYVVDCKSGFGSNEKGNTNRLLLVASVYKNIEPEDYRCLIWVRSTEDESNHYLQILKKSGLWEVSCGPETYARVKEFSGFDLGAWVKKNVTWKYDLAADFMDYLKKHDLAKYLRW